MTDKMVNLVSPKEIVHELESYPVIEGLIKLIPSGFGNSIYEAVTNLLKKQKDLDNSKPQLSGPSLEEVMGIIKSRMVREKTFDSIRDGIAALYAQYPKQDLACGDGYIYVRDPYLVGNSHDVPEAAKAERDRFWTWTAIYLHIKRHKT